MDNLKKASIKGVLWSGIERFGTQIILFVTQVVLARLLTPKEFGLIGMITIFIAISTSFVNSGFGTALIQKKDVNKDDFSTVFIYSIVVALLFYLILYLSAPWIASFFDQLELIGLTRVIGFTFVFASLGLVHNSILQREMDFKSISKITVFANVFASIVGITIALMGGKAYALAFQIVSIQLFRTLFLWIYCLWRPQWIFSTKSFKELFRFGSRLLFSGLLDQIFQNIYLLVIGKYFSAVDLGYYSQAKKFQEVPVASLAGVVGSVSFSAMSKIQDNEEKLRSTFRSLLRMLSFVNFPLMLGLAAVAHPLFFSILGEKWLDAVPYFQLLCISGMLYTLHTTNLSILNVKGRSDLFLRLEVIKKVITTIAIIIGFYWGIIGLVVGRVICSFISYFINCYYSGRIIGFSFYSQVKDIALSFISSIFMFLLIYAFGAIHTSILLLSVQIVAAILFYLVFSFFTRNQALVDIVKLLNEIKPLPLWVIRKF